MKVAMIIASLLFDLAFIPYLFFWCFGSIEGFFKSIFYGYKPDWLSFLDGTLQEDWENETNGAVFWCITLVVILFQLWVITGIK